MLVLAVIVVAGVVRGGLVLRRCRFGGTMRGDVVGVRVARVSGVPRMRKGVQGDGSALEEEGEGNKGEGDTPQSG